MNRRFFLKFLAATPVLYQPPKLLGWSANMLAGMSSMEDRVRALFHKLDLYPSSMEVVTNLRWGIEKPDEKPVLRVNFRVSHDRTDFARRLRGFQRWDDSGLASELNKHGFGLNLFVEGVQYTQNRAWHWNSTKVTAVDHPYIDVSADFYDITTKVYEGKAILNSIGLEDVGIVRVPKFGPPEIILRRAESVFGDYGDFQILCGRLFGDEYAVETADLNNPTTPEDYAANAENNYHVREHKLTFEQSKRRAEMAWQIIRSEDYPSWGDDIVFGMNDIIEEGYFVATAKEPTVKIVHEWEPHEVIGYLSGLGYLPIDFTNHEQSYTGKIPGHYHWNKEDPMYNEAVMGWACPEQDQ